MDVTCPECGRGFFIVTDVWERLIEDVRDHQYGECPHCEERMCFTCQYVPADVFARQGATRSMMPRSSHNNYGHCMPVL